MMTLQDQLNKIEKFGGHPMVVSAPADAVTFDAMIIIYLDETHTRLYQVHMFNTKTGQVVGTV
jgi:hypothetical protein